MFKDLSKLEKAGLIIGGMQCIAGFAISMYAHRMLVKQAEAVKQNIENTTPNLDNIHSDIFDQIDELLNKGEFDQDND